MPVPKRGSIVKCLFEAVKDCPKRKRCAPLRGGFAILDCLKQAALCQEVRAAGSSGSRPLSEARLDAVELAKTIEARFFVTTKVTKNGPKPLLLTQIKTKSCQRLLNFGGDDTYNIEFVSISSGHEVAIPLIAHHPTAINIHSLPRHPTPGIRHQH
jgi:hypothetical protein